MRGSTEESKAPATGLAARPDVGRLVGRGRRARMVRALTIVLVAVVVGLTIAFVVSRTADGIRERAETLRTTPRYDPPVWAGQIVPGACSGGFYARRNDTIVLTIVAHCATPGASLRDADGRLIGVFGPRAQTADCPINRFCSPSDILALELAADRIPWGHLNLVDLGAGGYHTIEAGTRPLACADMKGGERVEVDGREHYRTGTVTGSFRYEYATDTIFPCMIAADIRVEIGDSGGAVLVNGVPGGIISRALDGSALGFTPLAEGLENLGLTLCTTPDCDLSPERVIQPEG
jgi:hypothetical protein